MSTPADLAIRNGSVYTVDAAGSWSDAIAVRGGQIVALGSRDVAAVTTADTKVIDAPHTLVVPGFQDAHVHAPFAGLNRLHVDLSGLGGVDDYLRAIAAFERAHPHIEWIIGGGWALEHFPHGIASKRLLDAVCPNKPVFLFSRDVHAAWVNSEALRRAGIDDDRPDPPNGRIERDPDTGEVIGTLQEAAAYGFNKIHVPLPSRQMWEQAILEAQRHLCSLGITGWQDAWVTAATADAYRSLADQGRLLSRVVGAQWWEWDQGLEQIDRFIEERQQCSHPTFGAGTVKIMVDGILENYTGALLEPYCSGCGGAQPDSGMMHVDESTLRTAVTALDARGFQVHMHAIGDRAVRASLDAVEVAQVRNGVRDNRHHIAHLQLVHPDDLHRFRALGVVANCQTFWAKADAQLIDMTAPQIGESRARTMFPFGDLANSGATLAMGSDWAVTTANPLEQIEVATTRIDPADREASPFGPDQALTLPAALRAFTAGSAYVNHDRRGGSIELGKRADFAVIDRDLFDPMTGPVGDAKVIYTVSSGVIVYEL